MDGELVLGACVGCQSIVLVDWDGLQGFFGRVGIREQAAVRLACGAEKLWLIIQHLLLLVLRQFLHSKLGNRAGPASAKKFAGKASRSHSHSNKFASSARRRPPLASRRTR